MITDPKSIAEILRIGQSSDFWRLILQNIDATLAGVQEELDSPDMIKVPESDYKTINEILKAKKEYLLLLKELPNEIIMDLEMPSDVNEDPDPFQTAEELET